MGASISSWSIYDEEVFDLAADKSNTPTKIANSLYKKHSMTGNIGTFRRYISHRLAAKKVDASIPVSKTLLEKRLITIMNTRDSHDVIDIANRLDIGPSSVKKMIEGLQKQGYVFKLENDIIISTKTIPKSEPAKLDIQKMSTGFHKFGACGDNHMCSKYERQDVLDALYDEYERQGITDVFNTGNWIDGEARFNKNDLKVHGMDNQINYFIDNYPQRKGITTHFVAGDDHEGWYTQREGINIGQYAEIKALQAGRTDLKHLGYMEADVVLKAPKGKTMIRDVHPGGGSAYATSYTMQKLVESYQGGEKPHIVLAGHYHKAEYLYYRGVHIIQTACTCDQTPFMRKLKLAAHVGGWTFEFSTDDNGAVTRFKTEFFPFYDNHYYSKWKHK